MKNDINQILSKYFESKAKEHSVNELNLFIENRGTHFSLCVFNEYGENRILEEKIKF